MERRAFIQSFVPLAALLWWGGCEKSEKKSRCALCGMDITEVEYYAKAIDSKGRVYEFDDFGCMILYTQKHPLAWSYFVYARDIGALVDATKAHYSRTETTPMHYGFGAYKEEGEGRVSFEEAKEAMLKNETLANPLFRRVLLKRESIH